MRRKLLQAVLFSTIFANTALAHNVKLNHHLPSVSVSNDGELVAVGKNIEYRQWQASHLTGKVRVVFHIAGRSAAKEKNEGLVKSIKAAHFDRSKYQTTTIINVDDAVVGTGLFVKSSAEKGKLENRHSQIVLDQKGVVKKAWQLKEKESFVAVLDKTGKVQFVAEGKLSAGQIQEIISLIESLTE